MLKARESVLTMPSYHPPLAGREGLRLDFNENSAGCSPRVLKKMRGITAEDIARYPERAPVEQVTARFLDVEESQLLLTNGVDEAIHLLCQTYIEPGDDALIVVPTYSMYRIYMAAAGANIISVPAAEGFRFPTEEVLRRVTPRTRLIAIANPNNPTGAVMAADELLHIARSAPLSAVLADEAYFEFYGESLLPSRGEVPNAFVARTFSKVYGMAGLRVGALVGDSGQMTHVRRVCSPYNVNAAALLCLPEAIADQVYIRQYVKETLDGRAQLEGFLREVRIAFWSSRANFVLAKIGSVASASSFVSAMKRRRILVRDRSADYGCEGCVRITLGATEHNRCLIGALQETFEELGIGQGAMRR